MPDPSAGEIGGIFAGIVALLVVIGKGLGWLINLEDRRESTWHKPQSHFAAATCAVRSR